MSRWGLVLSGLYIFLSGLLIFSQGLFGESFIALILGLPWVLVLAYFEFFGIEIAAVLVIFTLAPMVLNAFLLYVIGSRLETRHVQAHE